MKKFKQTVCIVLCILMTFSCVSVCAAAEEFRPLPTVYLHGAAGSAFYGLISDAVDYVS